MNDGGSAVPAGTIATMQQSTFKGSRPGTSAGSMGCLIFLFCTLLVSCCGSIGSSVACHAAVLAVALCHGVAHCAAALHFLPFCHSFVVACVAVLHIVPWLFCSSQTDKRKLCAHRQVSLAGCGLALLRKVLRFKSLYVRVDGWPTVCGYGAC